MFEYIRLDERSAEGEAEAKASLIAVCIVCGPEDAPPVLGAWGARTCRVSGAGAVVASAEAADVDDFTLVGLGTSRGKVEEKTNILDGSAKCPGGVERTVSVFDKEWRAVWKGNDGWWVILIEVVAATDDTNGWEVRTKSIRRSTRT